MDSDLESPLGTPSEIQELDEPAPAGEVAAENQEPSIENRLLDAIKDGDLAVVKRCLDENADINSISSRKKLFSATPLSWAVCYGRREILTELLYRGADINGQSSDGLTPLNWAVRRNEEEILTELLRNRRVDKEKKGKFRDTPLWRAFGNRYLDCMVLLLKNGADVNAVNAEGESLLHRAVANNDAICVKLLLKNRANANFTDLQGTSVLQQAVAMKHTACVKALVERGADINTKNSKGVSILHQAVKSDDLEIVKVLLKITSVEEGDFGYEDWEWRTGKGIPRLSRRRLETDETDISSLLRAVINRSEGMVRLLLSADAAFDSMDLEGDSGLSRAIYDGSTEIAKLLIENDADIHNKNCTRMTAFLWAAYKDDVSVGEMLVARRVDISETDEDGLSALHFAVERGHVDFTEMLLRVSSEESSTNSKRKKQFFLRKRHSIIEIQESQGHTPLLFALSSPWYRQHIINSKKVVELLLKYGAKPSAKNNNQQNALHLAILQEFTEVVGMMLPRMALADVCAQDEYGDTPLHLACRMAEEPEKIVGLILENGDMTHEVLTAKNLKGETALSLTIEKRNSALLQLLVNNSADVRYRSKFGKEWPTVEKFAHQQIPSIEQILRQNELGWEPIDISGILNWSARNGRRSLMQMILSTKDYVTENLAKDVIYWAAVGGHSEIVSWLFQEYGEYIISNMIGSTAIQAAAINCHDSTVEDIIRNMVRLDENAFSVGKKEAEGFQVNTPEFGSTKMKTKEWTPLHWVVNYEPDIAIDIIRHMLMNGVDPEAKKGGFSAREMAIYWGRNTKIRALLQAPLRVPRKPPQLAEPLIGAGTSVEEACKRSPANIIDFFKTAGPIWTLERKSTVYDLIYKRKSGPDAVMKEARNQWSESLEGMNLKLIFRWIHLPANNWAWAEDLAKRIYFEPQKPTAGYTRVKSFMEAYRREHKGKPFCRFMYPALSFEREEFPSAGGDAISSLNRNLTVPSAERKNENADLRDRQNPLGSNSQNTSEKSDSGKSRSKPSPEKTHKVRLRVINKELTRKKNTHAATHHDGLGVSDVYEEPPQAHRAVPQLPQFPEEKPKKDDIESGGVNSALRGIKMSICVPFLTFHSVSGHRALRQTLRLTEEVKRQQSKIRETCEASISPPINLSNQEERRNAERVQKNETRKLILEFEVKKGFKLLRNTSIKLYEYFVDRWDEIKDYNEEEMLRSLRNMHLAMRRNVESNAPGIMEWLERLSDAISISSGLFSESEVSKHELLLENYLNPQDETGLHPSRTLDQYYYSALSDTSRRDVDQVVRRYQARAAAAQCFHEAEQAVIGKERDAVNGVKLSKKMGKFGQLPLKDEETLTPHWEDDPDAQICMVDQLWLWVLDDQTIVTCFPPSSGPQSKNKRALELLDRIRGHINDDTHPQISSVYHLATLITSLCVKFVEECQLESKDSLLHTFASSIGTVADEEVKCFENFRRDISQARKSQVKGDKRENSDDVAFYRDKIQKEIQQRVDKIYRERYPESKMEDFQKEVSKLEAIKSQGNESDNTEVDIQKEIMLLEEIKDIRDELNILKSIFEDQRNLLKKLFTLVRTSTTAQTRVMVDYYQERSDIDLRLEKVNKMEMDAKITYDSINHLLDLKQKNANLSEAVQARKQAEQSAQQGRTILVFTVVTIIFLPLSFLSSFYSLKVESFPRVGNDSLFPDTWIFSRIFGTSAALAIPLIILAVYVNDILKYYQKHIEQRLSNIWVGFKGIFTRPVTDCHKRRIESSRGKWGFNLLAFRKKDRLPTIEDGKNR